MKYSRFLRLAALLAISTTMSFAIAMANDTLSSMAVIPASRADAGWLQRHKAMNVRVQKGHVDLLFIGDSITHGWEWSGKDVWNEFYGKRNAVNLGISGDKTSHVCDVSTTAISMASPQS